MLLAHWAGVLQCHSRCVVWLWLHSALLRQQLGHSSATAWASLLCHTAAGPCCAACGSAIYLCCCRNDQGVCAAGELFTGGVRWWLRAELVLVAVSAWLLLRGCWHWWFWQAGYWHTGVSRQLLLCRCQLLLSGATYQLSLRRQQFAAKGFVWRQWLYCGGSVPHCWMAVGVYVLYQREQQLVQPVSAGLCNLVCLLAAVTVPCVLCLYQGCLLHSPGAHLQVNCCSVSRLEQCRVSCVLRIGHYTGLCFLGTCTCML